jgi:hypothetical protein
MVETCKRGRHHKVKQEARGIQRPGLSFDYNLLSRKLGGKGKKKDTEG